VTQDQPKYSRDEVAQRGKDIYRTQIRPKLWPEYKGKIVVIDVDTGEFEVADDGLTACRRLRERCPQGQFWSERVGYVAVVSFGGRRIPEDT
jgi:hypothetical protein